MGKSELSASMMCLDLSDLKEHMRILEAERIEYLHIDVMDGEFVPNLGFGTDYIRSLRKMTFIPLDLHLMICRPECKLGWFGITPDDIVSIHYESTCRLHQALEVLKKYGCRRFLAIRPATPVRVLEDVLPAIEGVNLLAVEPGFAGQRMVPGIFEKAEQLQRFLREKGYEHLTVEVDGNITPENGAGFRRFGAEIFVAGSSSIFKKEGTGLSGRIEQLRASVQ